MVVPFRVADVPRHPLLARKLAYTAVTRGKQLVIVVGQKKAMAVAVRASNAGRRWTKLDECLGAIT